MFLQNINLAVNKRWISLVNLFTLPQHLRSPSPYDLLWRLWCWCIVLGAVFVYTITHIFVLLKIKLSYCISFLMKIFDFHLDIFCFLYATYLSVKCTNWSWLHICQHNVLIDHGYISVSTMYSLIMATYLSAQCTHWSWLHICQHNVLIDDGCISVSTMYSLFMAKYLSAQCTHWSWKNKKKK